MKETLKDLAVIPLIPFVAVGVSIVLVITILSDILDPHSTHDWETVGYDKSRELKYEQVCNKCNKRIWSNEPEDGVIKSIIECR